MSDITEFAVMTGPIIADLTLANGTTYDVTPPVVYVQSQDEADELARLIGEYYRDNGHPDVEGTFDYQEN